MFSGYIIVNLENLEELFELIEDFGRDTRYKIRIQKSIDYHIDCNKNEKLEM